MLLPGLRACVAPATRDVCAVRFTAGDVWSRAFSSTTASHASSGGSSSSSSSSDGGDAYHEAASGPGTSSSYAEHGAEAAPTGDPQQRRRLLGELLREAQLAEVSICRSL